MASQRSHLTIAEGGLTFTANGERLTVSGGMDAAYRLQDRRPKYVKIESESGDTALVVRTKRMGERISFGVAAGCDGAAPWSCSITPDGSAGSILHVACPSGSRVREDARR